MSFESYENSIQTADCFDLLAQLPDNCVHACVTDPPYGLAFMGRDWDDFQPKEYQEWCEEWAQEVKRVLKPGGHMLAFSGNRTHHRLFTGVEDAGFEVRDTITWHYGSGFPKASDISKTIDKRADAEREVIATREADDVTSGNYGQSDSIDDEKQGERTTYEYTEPATEEAEKWDGWKTGLKPATEYVVVARKPFDGATVDCVLEHGTGALNIGECRISSSDSDGFWPGQEHEVSDDNLYGDSRTGGEERHEKGRYPSNVVFDETEAERLDSKNDTTVSTGGVPDGDETDERVGNFKPNVQQSTGGLGDSGGVSRYFYTSKASKAERTENGSIENTHPTVKPIDLMEWLIKLVTREDQIVLDPFAGSGTTCKAAKSLNRRFMGIEKQAKWADVARVRCGLTPQDPSVVRDDENQQGMEAYLD